MTTLDSSIIREIGQRHIDQLTHHPVLKENAQQILNEWHILPESESHGFCRQTILPRIKSIRQKKMRAAAMTLFSNIQFEIADHAASAALEIDRQRSSVRTMANETIDAYEVINRQGRGIVYLGSARTKPGEKEYELARELGRDLALLLGSTSWSGAGPGQMDAPLRGAKEAGGKIGGVKIMLDGNNSKFEEEISDVFAPGEVSSCTFFAPRKIGLVDAAMRKNEMDKTAVIVFPGGFGTLDEFYELIVLKQLGKLGTQHTVPIMLMNYDHYFDLTLQQHRVMLKRQKISPHDLGLFTVCTTNNCAVRELKKFYKMES